MEKKMRRLNLDNFFNHLDELLARPDLPEGIEKLVNVSVEYSDYPLLTIKVKDCPPIHCRTFGETFRITERDNLYYQQHRGPHSIYTIMYLIEKNIRN